MKHEEWCKCDNENPGFYYDKRGEENECECDEDVPHIHCQNCGGLVQVS